MLGCVLSKAALANSLTVNPVSICTPYSIIFCEDDSTVYSEKPYSKCFSVVIV